MSLSPEEEATVFLYKELPGGGRTAETHSCSILSLTMTVVDCDMLCILKNTEYTSLPINGKKKKDTGATERRFYKHPRATGAHVEPSNIMEVSSSFSHCCCCILQCSTGHALPAQTSEVHTLTITKWTVTS